MSYTDQAIFHKMVKRRATDGVTLNKILFALTSASLSICIGVLTWVYTTDRNEFKENIKSIARNVEEIKLQQTITYAHQENSDSRIEKNEKKLDHIDSRFNDFYRKQKRYWDRLERNDND